MELESGKLQKHNEMDVEAGSGPRHLIFNSNGQYAYLLNELNSTLHVYRYNPTAGTFHTSQIVSTLPESFAGENYCSDLHFSADEKYLYISNRGHDSIVCFNVSREGAQLTYQSHISSGGQYPRSFAVDPNGRLLVAAHQKSDQVTVFKINAETGDLLPTGQEVKATTPVHVLFVDG
jgi:6-phosphogluconolactonase